MFDSPATRDTPPGAASPHETVPDEAVLDETVLGIDPGLSACGFGAVRRAGDSFEAVASGAIRTERTLPLATRLAALQDALADLVADLDPIAVVVERVLFQTNARTAISVGQASGLALVVAARQGSRSCSTAPTR
ncbi:MAG: crossover junction endodeoxyribonuclease RuvC [Acidimicrobiia bacterium]|nr:crossover junction endodeoxyribonuclease RuvC [Acidimicrobiia bacterium]